MSIERAIHERWLTWHPLCQLVPEGRVLTGAAKGNLPFPYVTLERLGDAQTTRTSSGSRLDAVQLRFSIWDEWLDRAKQVADAVLQRFHRADFDWSGGKVLDCRQVGYQQLEENDGVWHVMLDYIIRASQSIG